MVFGMHISVQQKANWCCRKHWFVFEKERRRRKEMTELKSIHILWKVDCDVEFSKAASAGQTNKRHCDTQTDKTPAEGFWAELLQNSFAVFYFRCQVNAWRKKNMD